MERRSVAYHLRLFTQELEELIGPLLVFTISYCHHLYFAHHTISTFFIISSLLSIVCVYAFSKIGICLAGCLQLIFLGWVALDAHELLLKQTAFSASVMIALFATLFSKRTVAPVTDSAVEMQQQKQKLWQQLYEARQELTTLYQQKEQAIAEKKELEEVLSLNRQHQQVLELEKEQFLEEREGLQQDITKLLSHLHEMAERQVATQAANQAANQATDEMSADHRYLQLREQFEEKSAVLDKTRKELFSANEEIAVLQRTLAELHLQGSSETETLLMKQLIASEEKYEQLVQVHEQELLGYEHMIEKLLGQVGAKS